MLQLEFNRNCTPLFLYVLYVKIDLDTSCTICVYQTVQMCIRENQHTIYSLSFVTRPMRARL